jgi:hypothetical protein
MPLLRETFACRFSPPLLLEHEAPATVVVLTATVADWLALPPGPEQVIV